MAQDETKSYAGQLKPLVQKEALRYALQCMALLQSGAREAGRDRDVDLTQRIVKCLYLALDENPPEDPGGLRKFVKWFLFERLEVNKNV